MSEDHQDHGVLAPLVAEHRVIEQGLDRLDRLVDAWDDGRQIDPVAVLAACDFLGGYADGLHHRKEEDVVFVLTAEAAPDDVPIHLRSFVDDHVENRDDVGRMRAAAEQALAAGPDAEAVAAARGRAWRPVRRAALDLVDRLRSHIQREDIGLFTALNEVIDDHGLHAAVEDGFAAADAAVDPARLAAWLAWASE